MGGAITSDLRETLSKGDHLMYDYRTFEDGGSDEMHTILYMWTKPDHDMDIYTFRNKKRHGSVASWKLGKLGSPKFVLRYNGNMYCLYASSDREAQITDCDGSLGPCLCGMSALLSFRRHYLEYADDPPEYLVAWQGRMGRHQGGLRYALEMSKRNKARRVYPVLCLRNDDNQHKTGLCQERAAQAMIKEDKELGFTSISVGMQEDALVIGLLHSLAAGLKSYDEPEYDATKFDLYGRPKTGSGAFAPAVLLPLLFLLY